MALLKCKECAYDVSSKADEYPNCGNPLKRKSTNIRCLPSLIIIIFFVFIVNAVNCSNEQKMKIAKFGEPPINSPWDGSIDCVKQYLEKIAKDPDSLKLERWSEVYYTDDGWIVWCQYMYKNSSGTDEKHINWFVIDHNKVIAMKNINAYKVSTKVIE